MPTLRRTKKKIKAVESLEVRRFKFVKKELRWASLKWEERTKAKNRARIKRGFYKCEECNGEFNVKDIELDHIEPVQPVNGKKLDYNEYLERLLPTAEEFQVLCTSCHNGKTLQENLVRDIFKKKK